MSEFSERPLRRVFDLQQEINEAFAELIDRPWRRTGATSWWPPTDVYERDDAYVLMADLPGVGWDEVELRIEGREVTVCGYRSAGGMARMGQSVSMERTYGRFCRTFRFDVPIDAERAESGYQHGVYWARLPKR